MARVVIDLLPDDDGVWVPAQWRAIHRGAIVRMPGMTVEDCAVVESIITQSWRKPWPHEVVKAELLTLTADNQPSRHQHDFDPAAPVEVLISPAAARAVAMWAATRIGAQVIYEYDTEERAKEV